jgi:hypothetical protein
MTIYDKEKCRCDCGWKGHSYDLIACTVTRTDTGQSIGGTYVCPKCLDPLSDDVIMCCDEPGCWEPRSCGTPTQAGYRQTCGRHAPRT